MAIPTSTDALPSVNGVPLTQPDETLAADELRQRACTELLRQEAIAAGLLDADDPAPVQGAPSRRCWNASCPRQNLRRKPAGATMPPTWRVMPSANVRWCATCSLP